MVRLVDKKTYINSIDNGEKAFLIFIDEDNVIWLLADLEIGGDSERYRVELMDFELNPQEDILLTTVECRGFYCGGITFIEYDKKKEETFELALGDFIMLKDNAKYLICDNNDLLSISRIGTNQYMYIYVN